MVFTFNQLKKHLTGNALDNSQEIIEQYAEAAESFIEKYLGYPIIEKEIEVLATCSDDFIDLPHRNIKANSLSVKTIDGTTLDVKSYFERSGFVVLEKEYESKDVVCTYTVGWEKSKVPKDIAYCITQLVAYFFKSRNDTNTASQSTVGGNITYEKNIPIHIYSILKGYRV